MKNIKLYELEEKYFLEKDSHVFPTVSYARNTDTVYYMPEPSYFIAKYDCSNVPAGQRVNFFSGSYTKYIKEMYVNDQKLSSPTNYLSINNEDELIVKCIIAEEGLPSSIDTFFKLADTLVEVDLSHLDTSNVTDMSGMFESCDNLISIKFGNKFNTSNVVNMSRMFRYSEKLTSLDLSSFDTSDVTDMSGMFNGCSGLTSVTMNGDVSKVTNVQNMFYQINTVGKFIYNEKYDYSLIIDVLPRYWYSDGDIMITVNVTSTTQSTQFLSSSASRYLMNSVEIEGEVITGTPMSYTFSTTGEHTIKLTMGKTTYMYSLFSGCTSITEVDFSNFNASKVTTMNQLFAGCTNLTSVTFNNTDTSNVSNMSEMFRDCKSLTSIDLNNLDMSNATDISGMFARCVSFDFSNITCLDISNVVNIGGFFNGCSGITSLDLSGWNTSNVTNMSGLFSDCYKLSSITFGDTFDTSKVTDMSYMFRICSALTSLDLSSFNTSNVTTMENMFRNCSRLSSLDLSSFDTANVTNMTCMFLKCGNMQSIKMMGDVSNVSDVDSMFYSITGSGTFYYNANYDYSVILAQLPQTWIREPI